MKLLLASSSKYRRTLLQQLGLPFDWASPEIDETPLALESAAQLVIRLAQAKATALADDYPQHWIIGSDQVCVLDGQIRGKPGTADNAMAQLRSCSGKRVEFLTGLTLLQPQSGQCFSLREAFYVHFRELSEEEIRAYVQQEQPLDCAGSFKVEGLGIQLFSALEGRDYNSLIGLPLIGLCDLLRQAGINPLLSTKQG
jgi:septum formation protein